MAAMIARFSAGMQPRPETDAMRDARLYYRHGLDRMEDPNGPNLQRPTGSADLYGRGKAMQGAVKDAARTAAKTM